MGIRCLGSIGIRNQALTKIPCKQEQHAECKESTQSCKKRLERLAVGGWSLDIHGKQANHNQHCYGPGAGITAFKKQPTSQDIPWGYLMVSAVYLWPTEIHNRDEIQYTPSTGRSSGKSFWTKIKNDLGQWELPVKWGNEEVLMSTMSKMNPVWLFTHSLPFFQVIGAKLYWSPLSIPPAIFLQMLAPLQLCWSLCKRSFLGQMALGTTQWSICLQ